MGKNKKKVKLAKGTTVNLSEFLGDNAAVMNAKPITSWANEMGDDGDLDINSMKLSIAMSALPSAPRAAREPDALAMNEGQLHNRKVIDLATSSLGGDNHRDGNRHGSGHSRNDDGNDRTAGDWRKAPRANDNYYNDQNRSYRGPPLNDRRVIGCSRNDDSNDRTAGDWRKAPRANYARGDNDHCNDRDRGFRGSLPNNNYGNSYRDRYGNRDHYVNRDRGYDQDRLYDDHDDGRRSYRSGYMDQDRDSGRRYSPPRNHYDNGRYGGRDRYEPPRRDYDGPQERPRLALAPRTKPVENAPPAANDRAAHADRPASSKPFGNAKPVDTTRFQDKSREEWLKAAVPASHHHASERPHLNLQKRTKPVETAAPAIEKSSIFGGAKPVDTAKREQQIEERLVRERQAELETEQREKKT